MADAALKAPVLGGVAGKTVALDGAAFSAGFHGPLVHQSVRAEQAARRRGTAATKTRAMVSGGSAKPWRQKGTGRARAGSSRSPIWTGGGTVFGPHPRSYTFKVNRKEQRAALRSALSLHATRGSLAVIDASAFTVPKTSQAMDLLDDWNLPIQPRPTLVALAPEESNAALSFRNLARVAVLAHEDVGVTDIVGAATLVLSQAALDALTARAGGGQAGADGGESAAESATTARAPGSKGAAKAAAAKATADASASSPEAPAEAAKDGAPEGGEE
ncbi:MAG TPA: 50S ribosomal protein L4 [Solirubrobacteraceae bacterium]|jgi:large subunit ribosomal protein L4|nr:50S ribosomal protein L4 [Solirubrobacteraceae bacterium]